MNKKEVPRFHMELYNNLQKHAIGNSLEIAKMRTILCGGGYRQSRRLVDLIIIDMIRFGLFERGKGRNKNLLFICNYKRTKQSFAQPFEPSIN